MNPVLALASLALLGATEEKMPTRDEFRRAQLDHVAEVFGPAGCARLVSFRPYRLRGGKVGVKYREAGTSRTKVATLRRENGNWIWAGGDICHVYMTTMDSKD